MFNRIIKYLIGLLKIITNNEKLLKKLLPTILLPLSV